MKKFSEIDKQITEQKKTMEILPTGLPQLDFDLEGGFLKKAVMRTLSINAHIGH